MKVAGFEIRVEIGSKKVFLVLDKSKAVGILGFCLTQGRADFLFFDN